MGLLIAILNELEVRIGGMERRIIWVVAGKSLLVPSAKISIMINFLLVRFHLLLYLLRFPLSFTCFVRLRNTMYPV